MPSIPGLEATWGSRAPRGLAVSSSMGLQAASANTTARGVAVSGNNFMGNSSKDVEQLDVENQGGIWPDRAAGGAACAIGKLAGDPEPVLGADRHQRHAFGPAGDDLSQAELGRLAAIIGTVEHRAIKQGAVVVHADAIGRRS